jgi:hypothetical protein
LITWSVPNPEISRSIEVGNDKLVGLPHLHLWRQHVVQDHRKRGEANAIRQGNLINIIGSPNLACVVVVDVLLANMTLHARRRQHTIFCAGKRLLQEKAALTKHHLAVNSFKKRMKQEQNYNSANSFTPKEKRMKQEQHYLCGSTSGYPGRKVHELMRLATSAPLAAARAPKNWAEFALPKRWALM